ncbi:hypothetical protein SEMRO_1450_G273740.1 [Seminavis robusta]|uniref:Uncharacterized protein n=1 Tax=Seminavis robusta TaxID=568900 RepID=A0A9N8HQJ5_9STRA|nr:hypothetical protein SEMRO_1450_G273740.1 [Seminavis robusta]|eukprot:Sro1450_g273740.1 n/a (465) ;mRNA; f:2541-3935
MTQDFQGDHHEDDHQDAESDDGQLHEEAALNCYFHVVQAFAKKNSYVGKIKDAAFAANRKDQSKRTLQGTAYQHVTNISRTKSIEQRRTVTDLYMASWRERGEHNAADHFVKEYCQYPKWNWNYSCSGEVGVYPSNCPNESFNRHGIKSVCADNAKNASLTHFLVHTAKSLLREDANTRGDPCTILVPTTCSPLMVSVTGFVREGIDIIEMGIDETGNATGGWLGNLRHRIGIPLDADRVRMITAAIDGDERHFRRIYSGTTSDVIADAMVSATNTVCHLQWKDGSIVGDCDDCVKHLGYNCPCACYLRSKFGLLEMHLEGLRKTNSTAHGTVVRAPSRGSTKRMYKSGLSSSNANKRRCLPQMLDTFESYLATLHSAHLANLVRYLCLIPRGVDATTFVKSNTAEDLLEALTEFYDNSIAYRKMLRGSDTSYTQVRNIVSRIRMAIPPKENQEAKGFTKTGIL